MSLNSNISKIEGGYEISLPWVKEKKPLLHSNAKQALMRLDGLEKKLSRDQILKEGYNEVLKTMEKTGIIEEVDKEPNSSTVLNPVFYLPHRPVVKSSSTKTKIRRV